MREIRFRAWDKELVVMRSWEYLRENNFNYNREWYRDNTGEDKPNDIWSDDDLTPEQFTGLKDRNGREIYEGDILRFPPRKDKGEETNFVAYEVFWHDGDEAHYHIGWQMNRLHFQGNICGYGGVETFLPKWVKKMDVIGNIHENGDLLK